MASSSLHPQWIEQLRSRRIWRQTMCQFLPLAGLITAILLPSMWLYEENRQATIRGRLEIDLVAAELDIKQIFQRLAHQTALFANSANLSQPGFSQAQTIFLQTRETNPHLVSQIPAQRPARSAETIALVRDSRQLTALADLSGWQWQAGEPAPAANAAISRALIQGEALPSGSLLFMNIAAEAWGSRKPVPSLLTIRRFTDPNGIPGSVVIRTSADGLMQSFNAITNQREELSTGFLVHESGAILNPAAIAKDTDKTKKPARPAHFSTNFPAAWKQIQSHPEQGYITTNQGLFIYKTLAPIADLQGTTTKRIPRWTVVLRVPPASLQRTSAFTNPAGQITIVALYLLLLAFAINRSLARESLRLITTAKQSADERFLRAMQEAPVGMALLQPNGTITSVNRQLCEFFERPEDELI